MNNKLLTTVFNEDKSESFKLYLYFEESSFYLTIFENNSAWKQTVTKKDLQKFANSHEINLADYFTKLKGFFDEPGPNVIFSLEKKPGKFFVHCGIQNNDKTLKIQYFNCNLNKVEYEKTVENLLETFYENVNELSDKLNETNKAVSELEIKNSKLKSKLEKFITNKETEENELYSNFALVLNEKKTRIQHLSELLEAFKKGRPTLNPVVETKKGKRKKTETSVHEPESKVKVISESEDSESVQSAGYNTDEESNGKSGNNLAELSSKLGPVPGTSTDDYNFMKDDSPPRKMLPVFQKREIRTKSSQVYVSQPSTSTIESKKNKIINNSQDVGGKVQTKQSDTDINVNTQDLLDML